MRYCEITNDGSHDLHKKCLHKPIMKQEIVLHWQSLQSNAGDLRILGYISEF